MPGRPPWSTAGSRGSDEELGTNVSAKSAQSVKFVSADSTATVAPNSNEQVHVRAPSGKIWTLLNVWVGCKPPGSATSGNHSFEIRSEKNYIAPTFGRSSYSDNVVFKWGWWHAATEGARPAKSNAATGMESIRGLQFDESNGIQVAYTNATDAEQTNQRNIKLWVMEETING